MTKKIHFLYMKETYFPLYIFQTPIQSLERMDSKLKWRVLQNFPTMSISWCGIVDGQLTAGFIHCWPQAN